MPNKPTRRAALATVAAAIPAWSQPAAGAPVVHFEIGCRDRAKTEQFYAAMFNWPMQPAGLASQIAAAGPKAIPGQITALGHEPHNYTLFYVEVPDVKTTLDAALAMGAKTLVPPVKTPAFTFAWFADPEGNKIGLKSPHKPGPTGPGRPVVHFEIGCRNLAQTTAFYKKIFHWKGEPTGPATLLDTNTATGATGHITALGHEPHNYTIFYVEVDDVRSALNKAIALGGKQVVPAVKTPTFTFAWIADPEGNTLGLIKNA